MFEAHKNGGSFWRPLFFEFPEDDGAVEDVEHTFMVGAALKVTPVLISTSESTTIESYFPSNSRFLNLITRDVTITGNKGERITLDIKMKEKPANKQRNQNLEFMFPCKEDSNGLKKCLLEEDDPPEFPLLHMKEGTIIPFQEFGISQTTSDLVGNHPVMLIIFPDRNLNAEGTLYIDNNGVDLDTIENKLFQYYRITASDGMIRFSLIDGLDAGGKLDRNQYIQNISIADATDYLFTDFACMLDENMDAIPLSFGFDEVQNSLYLWSNDNNNPIELRTLRGIQFGNHKEDKSFCNPEYIVQEIKVEESGENSGKVMSVRVDASNGNLRSFNAVFNLMKDNLINVDFVPVNSTNVFEIPSLVLNESMYPFTTSQAKLDITQFVTVPEVGKEFFFEIHTLDAPNQVLFSTKEFKMILSTYFKSMIAQVDSSERIFGIGERFGNFWRKEGRYAVWNRGAPQQFDDGNNPGNNLYSSHPVYFAQRTSKKEWFGVYEHNSGPQEFNINFKSNGAEITSIKTSGRTNLFFLMNDKDLNKVIQNFNELIGKPTLQPRWAFGWHQSRFGYNTTEALRDVYFDYFYNDLPLDALWSDVDIYEDFRTFDIEKELFKGVSEFLNDIKEKGVRYVPIIGSGIPAGNSWAYRNGKHKNVFLKSPANNKDILFGRNTPGDVVFPDFFHKNAEDFWRASMEKLQDLPYDGLWLDMGEVTSQCDGYCYADQRAKNPLDNRLFYWPGGRDLERNTISIDAMHAEDISELDAHSLFGIMQSYHTHNFFNSQNMRSFVMSRSTFTGSGKYTGHWLGDNDSTYTSMRYSIHNIFLFNTFGIPFTGADVCGFKLNATASSCAKWYKVAAIYPFARNHNDINTKPQEPYQPMFDEVMDETSGATARDVIRRAMLIRYGLHNYMYTLFHMAATDGIPVFKPLFFNYPDEDEAYENIHNNVLIGNAVKASPDTEVFGESTYYFPDKEGDWCPIWGDINSTCIRGGNSLTLEIPAEEVMLHLHSGYIIPLQLSNAQEFDSITDVKNLENLQNKYTDLAVFIDRYNVASGNVRFDDGESTDFTLYDEIIFNAVRKNPLFRRANVNITFEVTQRTNPGPLTNSQRLGEVIFYNARSINMVNVEGYVLDRAGNSYEITSSYDADTDVNRISYNAPQALPFREIERIWAEVF